MNLAKNRNNSIVILAYFNRYGYFVIMILILLVLKSRNVTGNGKLLAFFSMFALYGIYTLLGLIFNFKHLYCAMQNAYHQKMTPNDSTYFTNKMQRDLKFIGFFFTIVGILGIAVTYFGI